MNLDDITPLILTYNEAPNIGRTLSALKWAKEIIIIDSFSADETLEIVNQFEQVEVFQRKFDSFADQCNFGLTKIRTEWVLSLDADYYLTSELLAEIQKLSEKDLDNNGFLIGFKYCVFGKPLSGALLPPRKILYRKEFARYQNDGHSHKVYVKEPSQKLSSFIYHDDRKPLARWLWAQSRYMALETEKLLKTPDSALSLSDKIRKTKILAPLIVPFYCLVLKGGLLDGWNGWYYALQRTLAEILLSLHLIEAEIFKHLQD